MLLVCAVCTLCTVWSVSVALAELGWRARTLALHPKCMAGDAS